MVDVRLQGGRVLITGAAGMLGSQLWLDAPAGFGVVGTDLATTSVVAAPGTFVGGVDLCVEAQVRRVFAEHGPLDAVLHPAAYTAVDRAEDEEERASAVNAAAAEHVARACRAAGIPLLLVGTDFVFDGEKRAPYREEDPVAPLCAYGRTKLEGEQRARAAHPDGLVIVRTQWLYGPRGKHFPGTMLRLARERARLRVVDDQIGAPTSTLELAPALWDALRLAPPGLYHAACEGQCSWYELAAETLRLAGVAAALEPCTSAQYPTRARRPAFSVLDGTRLAALRGRRLAPWRRALADFVTAAERESVA